jgi:5,10-methylene-tetrahydrofolate dehydrogenase/Methenyl tetrahydrofolate cyclohydrolase
MAQIIDGKKISAQVRAEIKSGVELLKRERGITPGLSVVLVGEDPASQVYVRNKTQACEAVGMGNFQHNLPEQTTEPELRELILSLNRDPAIHGILVQLPLPRHLKGFDVMQVLDPIKDVDGMHPLNLGNLASGREGFRSCTPFGVMRLLQEIGCELEGKSAVVLGRSVIVGKPMGLMLLEKNATVTYCHSRTRELDQVVRGADLVVAAVGIPRFVKGDWIKPGAVVIDVGINRLPDGKLAGDVDFEAAAQKASWITPVPGGVGPMTIAMLLYNTLEAAKKAHV